MLGALSRQARWQVNSFRVGIALRSLHTESKIEAQKVANGKAKPSTINPPSPKRPSNRQVTISINQPEQAVRKVMFCFLSNIC
jgi:hypothetical protein